MIFFIVVWRVFGSFARKGNENGPVLLFVFSYPTISRFRPRDRTLISHAITLLACMNDSR